jgi:phosphotriesterase-related protein
VTAEDMGSDVERTAELARRAGVRAVKSTGWFRSPSADRLVGERPAAELAARLVDDLTGGFPGSGHRAGCLGEVGVSGERPTPVEQRVLDATAEASRQTGAGIVLHTDDARNARALVGALLARGAGPERLQVGHARVADPIDWQAELLERGCVVAFDQVGHPRRDAVAAVAERVVELLGRGKGERIALSADVGRRSRLTAFGGGGYLGGLSALTARLTELGVPRPTIAELTGGTAAAFLAGRR